MDYEGGVAAMAPPGPFALHHGPEAGAADNAAVADAGAVAPITERLGAMLAPVVVVGDGELGIDAVTGWLQEAVALLQEAAAAHEALPDGDPGRARIRAATEAAVGFVSAQLRAVSEQIREATVSMTNQASLLKDPERQPALPIREDVDAFGAAVRSAQVLAGNETVPAAVDQRALLDEAAVVGQDAALACFQSLSVLSARETWQGGVVEPPGADWQRHRRDPEDPLNQIFADSGYNRYGVQQDDNDPSIIAHWCGMFVAASMYRGAGLDQEMRWGLIDVDNTDDFFEYLPNPTNSRRTPRSIWADGQWWSLLDYHASRGSIRKWTRRDDIGAAVAGGALDVRPGDVVLIDHSGRGRGPQHITMVEAWDPATGVLTTIEGNTAGIQADADGEPERTGPDDEYFKEHTGPDGSGLHTRDLNTMGTRPAVYQAAQRREPGRPRDAYVDRGGATVFGIGRPSIIDFEEHDYASEEVPERFQAMSPEEMRRLAAERDAIRGRGERYEGPEVPSVGLRPDA